jgi:hypothetical protein
MTTTTSTAAHLVSDRSDLRVPGAAGVLATASMIGAFFVLPADEGGSSPEDIAARYADGAAGYLRAATLEMLSLGLTAVLVAGLCAWVAQRSRVAATAAALGGAVVVTCQLAGYGAITTLAMGAAENAGTDVVTAIYDLSAILFLMSNVGLALLAAGVAVAAMPRHRVLAFLSAITAAAAATGALALQQDGFLSPHGDLGFLVLLLQLVWTSAAGVTLLRVRRGR